MHLEDLEYGRCFIVTESEVTQETKNSLYMKMHAVADLHHSIVVVANLDNGRIEQFHEKTKILRVDVRITYTSTLTICR